MSPVPKALPKHRGTSGMSARSRWIGVTVAGAALVVVAAVVCFVLV